MRRILFAIASVIAIITFSCDTTENSFDDAVPELYTLTTNVSPVGAGSVSPSGGEYVSGTGIQIRAIPSEDYIFERWTGDLTGNASPDSLFFTRNRNVTAHFIPRDYPLNIEIIGEGTVNEEIISQSVEETDSIPDRIAPSIREPEPAPDRIPERPGDANYEQYQQAAPVQGSVEESYEIQQELTASLQQETVTVRLTAVPADGWYFDRWEGDLTGSENPETIEVDEEKNVTAVFEQEEEDQFILNVEVQGQGFVDIDPDQTVYDDGDEVTLTAVPDADWIFTEWQGDLTGNANPETTIMDGDKEITALFELPGAPEMEIAQQPAETIAGTAITPAPGVSLTGDQGNPITGVDISVSLSDNVFASGSTTTVSTDENGIALFNNLIIETAATGYTLTFDADEPDVTNRTSEPFDVIAAAGDPSNSSAEISDGVAGETTVITILVLDQYNNPVSGAAGELSVTISGTNDATPSVTETGTAGQYTASYTPTGAGFDEIEITLNGTPISGSPFEIEVTTSDVSSSNSSVTADPTELQVGNSSEITITLRDDQNNAVSGLADEIELMNLGSATAGTILENGASGIYTTEITSETPEEITLTVIADGVTLGDTPIIFFLPGDADEIEIVSGNNQTGSVASTLDAPLVVRLSDSFGNLLEGETVDFEIDEIPIGALGQNLSETSVSTGSNGEAFTELTLGIMPGTYTVNASAGSAGSVTFTAQAELGLPSLITILQQPVNTTAGEVINPVPEVQITDDQQNPIEGIEVGVSVNGGEFTSSSTSQAVTDENGIAEFPNLVIIQAGIDYTLTFETDASGVDDIQSAPFDIVAAAGDPGQSTAQVPNGAAGNPTVITITVQDEFNNPVEGATSDLSLSVSDGPNAGAAFETVQDEGDGEYSTSYTPETIGFDEIAIELAGVPISGSPFDSEVITSDVSAVNSSVTADPSELAAGNSSTVTIELRDGSNNPISGLGDGDFSISVTGSAAAGVVSETPTDGTYEFEVTNNTAEPVTVTVTAGGVTLNDTPEILFTAGAADTMIITNQPVNSVAGQVIEGLPEVRITDSENNPVPSYEVTVSEQGGQNFEEGQLTVLTDGDGRATFDDLVINQAGHYNLVFSAAGVTNQTSNQFDVDPAGADASGTSANVPNGAAGDRTNITITVQDEFGNRVEGEAGNLSFSISGENEGAAVDPVADEGNGIYTTGYTPTSSGVDQVTIELNGIGIQGSPFTSNVTTSDAANVDIEQQPLETVAGQPIEGPPSVQVTDDLGNTVEGVEVSVSEQGGSIFDQGTLTLSTDGSGIATFSDLVINNSGIYTLVFDAVGVSENAVSGSFEVIPGPVSSNVSDVSANPSTLTVDDNSTLTIRVRDALNNEIENLTGSAFAIDITGNATTVGVIDEESPGNYQIDITNSTAETVSVTVSVNGVQLDVQPDIIFEAGNPESLGITQQPTSTTAGSEISPAPAVRVTDGPDGSGNELAGVNVSVSLNGGVFASGSTTQSTNINGVATFGDLVIHTAANGYTLTFQVNSLSETSDAFDVNTATADPSSSSADVPDGTAGDPTVITITVEDGFGNGVAGVSGDLNVSITSGPNQGAVVAAISDDGSGIYSTSYTPEDDGNDEITITLNNVAIDDGNPFTSQVSTGPPGDVSVAVVQGTAAADGLDDLEFLVTVEDANENPVSGVSVIATDNGTDITYTGGGDTQSTDGNGQVTFTATSATVQSNVTFTFTEQDNNNQATAQGSFEDSSGFSVADPGGQTAGTAFDLSITSGQGIDGGPLDGSVNVTVTSNVDGQVHNNAVAFNNGSATVPVTLTTATGHSLTVNVDGITDDETVAVTVTAGDATQISTLTIADPEIALDGSTTVTATVLDGEGNAVPDVTVGFTSNEPGRATVDASVQTGFNGQATAAVTGAGNEAGAVVITASISDTDANVATSDSETVGLTVLEGDADAGLSTIGANPESGVAADGTETSTLTITVRDGGGNLLEGEPVFFAITGGTGGTLSAGPWTTNAGGEATAMLTSTDANQVEVTGYLGTDAGGQAVGTATVDFIAGPPGDVSVAVVQGTAAADGLDDLEFLVTVEDAHENPVSGVSVIATDNGTDITYTGGGDTQSTDGNGQVTFTAASATVQSNVTFTFTEQVNSNQATAQGGFEDSSGFTVGDPGGQTAGTAFDLSITSAQGIDGGPLDGSVNVTVTSNVDGQVHNNAVAFSNGSVTVPVTLTTATGHSLTVNVDGITDDETVAVTVTAGAPGVVSVEAVQGTAAADGLDELEFLVTVEDAHENPVSGVDVLATDDGSGITYPDGAALQTGANGQVTFTATSATVQSNVTFTFTEQVNSNQATAQGSFEDSSGFTVGDPGGQTAGVPFNLGITNAQGTNGTPLDGNVTVTVTSNVDGQVHNNAVAFSNGSATVPVTLTTATGHSLTVNVDGITDDETVSVTVTAGDADAGLSTIGANPESGVAADGTETSTLTITVRDGGGNLLEGEPVFFAITGGTGGTLSAGPWTTNAGGEATATLTSTDANQVEVTGYLGTDAGGQAVGTATVDFIAGEPQEIVISEITSPQIVNESFEVTFSIHDTFENVVIDFEGTLNLSVDFGGIDPNSINYVDADDGEITQSVSLDTAGEDQIITAIWSEDSEVSGQSNTFEVIAE